MKRRTLAVVVVTRVVLSHFKRAGIPSRSTHRCTKAPPSCRYRARGAAAQSWRPGSCQLQTRCASPIFRPLGETLADARFRGVRSCLSRRTSAIAQSETENADGDPGRSERIVRLELFTGGPVPGRKNLCACAMAQSRRPRLLAGPCRSWSPCAYGTAGRHEHHALHDARVGVKEANQPSPDTMAGPRTTGRSETETHWRR